MKRVAVFLLFGGFLLVLLAQLPLVIRVTQAHSQGAAPSDGSLPAEFMKEVDAAPAAPPAAATAPSSAQNSPTPAAKSLPAKSEAVEKAAPQQAPPPPSASEAPPQRPALTSTALTSEEYIYDPAGRRDPFKPYRAVRPLVNRSESPTRGGDIEPLQNFELDQLTVIGILWDVRQPKALIQDTTGKVHTLVKNTKLGRNSGYVAAIREGEVVVIETFDEEGGGRVKKTRLLEFKKKE